MSARSRAMSSAMPKVEYSITRLGGGTSQAGASYPGGLDHPTPSLALQPGALRDVDDRRVFIAPLREQFEGG